MSALENERRRVDEDARRLKNAQKIRDLGGAIESQLLEYGLCPTCEQPVDDSLVATDAASTLESNIARLAAYTRTLESLNLAERRKVAELDAETARYEQRAVEIRGRIRSLKDELSSPQCRPAQASDPPGRPCASSPAC